MKMEHYFKVCLTATGIETSACRSLIGPETLAVVFRNVEFLRDWAVAQYVLWCFPFRCYPEA